MIEGSGAGSGSIPLTSGSGSWRPKNMWIRWIRNTARKSYQKNRTVVKSIRDCGNTNLFSLMNNS
jgi:hypothetical protein